MEDKAFDMDGILTEEEARELFGGGDPAKGDGGGADDARLPQGGTLERAEPPQEVDDESGEDADEGDGSPAADGGGADGGAEGGGEAVRGQGGGASPGVFSSIAAALKEEGLLDGLEDADVGAVKDAQGLSDLFDRIVDSRLDARTASVARAMDAGLPPGEEREYQANMDALASYTDDVLKDEGERGRRSRENLISFYFKRLGFDEAKCRREAEKSMKAGTDVEDAMEARDALAAAFRKGHDDAVRAAKDAKDAAERDRRSFGERLEKAIMDADVVMDGVAVDRATRRKAYDFIAKPAYKGEDGRMLTGFEKAFRDDAVGTYRSIALWFALTDGGRKLAPVVDGKVKEARHRALDDLARKLQATSMNPDGSLNYAGGGDSPKGDVLLDDRWRIGR